MGQGLSLSVGTVRLCSGREHPGNASLLLKKANDISKRGDSAGSVLVAHPMCSMGKMNGVKTQA